MPYISYFLPPFYFANNLQTYRNLSWIQTDNKLYELCVNCFHQLFLNNFHLY